MNGEKLKNIADTVHRVLFGERLTCVSCGAELFEDGYFCRRCLDTLSFNDGLVCSKCGRAIAEDYPVCLECKAHMPSFDAAKSAFRYEGEIVRLIKKFKTGGRYLAAAFADRMYLSLLTDFSNADFLVPVPMTAEREKKRGYNQAKLLAEELALRSGVPVGADVLLKTRDTSAQKELSRKAREENLKGSFHVARRKECRGKRIVLVDDVLTTGSTADAAARALLGAGAAKVYVLTAASVAYRAGQSEKETPKVKKQLKNR